MRAGVPWDDCYEGRYRHRRDEYRCLSGMTFQLPVMVPAAAAPPAEMQAKLHGRRNNDRRWLHIHWLGRSNDDRRRLPVIRTLRIDRRRAIDGATAGQGSGTQ